MSAADSCQFLSMSLPGQVPAGASFPITISFKNTGSVIWTPGSWRCGLGKAILPNGTGPDDDTYGLHRLDLTGNVTPGGTATFTGQLTAPAQSSPFVTRMVKEGAYWLNNASGGLEAGNGTVNVGGQPGPTPGSFPKPYPLKTSVVFTRVINTGPQPSDGKTREFPWTNGTGSDLLVRYAQLWCGVAMGSRADTNGEVSRDADGQILWDLGWDRYAEVTGPYHQKAWNYEKDLDFILKAGDTLRLKCFGNKLEGSILNPGHHFILTLGCQWLSPPA